jgi:hypothetical protein
MTDETKIKLLRIVLRLTDVAIVGVAGWLIYAVAMFIKEHK